MTESTSLDTIMSDTQTQPSSTTKRKPDKVNRGHEIRTLTIKSPPFSYVHLSLTSSSPLPSSKTPPLDPLTAKTYITAALRQFLGDHGLAISVDILKVTGQEVWLRVPRQDRAPFLAAVGGWTGSDSNGGEEGKIGWLVKGASNWLGSLVGKEGEGGIWVD